MQVHDHDSGVAGGDDTGHLWVRGAADVVDQNRAGFDGSPGDLGLVGIHCHRPVVPTDQLGDQGRHPLNLLAGGDRIALLCCFAAHFDHVRALADHLVCASERRLGAVVTAAIVERIGSVVQNPGHIDA